MTSTYASGYARQTRSATMVWWTVYIQTHTHIAYRCPPPCHSLPTTLASHCLSALLRLQAVVVAVLPGGAGSLGSHDLWNNRVVWPAAGSKEERHLFQDRCVCVCVCVCVYLSMCLSVCVNVCEYRQLNFALFFYLAAFTYHQFNQFLKTVTIPCIWIGVLSLTWEIVTSMFRYHCPFVCVCV